MRRLVQVGLLVLAAALLTIAPACGDDDDGGEDLPTNVPLFGECETVDQCLLGEEEGGQCVPSSADPTVSICTKECETREITVPDPEVGGCYEPFPADTCEEGCCLLDSVEVINDYGDETGYGVCQPA